LTFDNQYLTGSVEQFFRYQQADGSIPAEPAPHAGRLPPLPAGFWAERGATVRSG
jgi:hypothetical protein